MKNTLKIILTSLVAAFVVIACRDDADRNWTTPDGSLTLHNTSIGATTLYPSMKDNPFVLGWSDSNASGGSYTVTLSDTEDFENKVELGTSETNSLKISIEDLNTAILKAGLSPYNAQNVYIRVESGSAVSNAIVYNLKPYPSEKPLIINPKDGDELVLDAAKATEAATIVEWSDYAEYGVDVEYHLEIAAAGTPDFHDAGSIINEKSLEWITNTINEAVLKTGAKPGEASDIDVRVTATTSSAGGNISITSDVVTFKVTPYESNVTLYLIGDATAADWDNSAGNVNMYPLLGSHENSNQYTFTGYFKAGGFKIVKEKGSWDAQYGLGGAEGELSTDGGSGNIVIPSNGYYKLSIDVSALTYTLESVAVGSPVYANIGIIGDATPNGWDGDTDLIKSTFDEHIWYLTDVVLGDGAMKFRADHDWVFNWGSDETDFGTGVQDGNNITVSPGTYDIYFNDITGAFVFIKK